MPGETVQRNMVVRLKADGSSLSKGLRAGQTALRGFGRAARGVGRTVFSLGGGLTALAGTAGLLALANASRTNIDRMAKLATGLKGTAAEVQELKLVAELSGTGLETITKAASKAAQVLGKQLLTPSKEVTDALTALGVSAKDFQGQSPVKVFKALVPEIAKIKDPLVQAAIGQALFGRGFRELLPLIEDSSAAFGKADVVFRQLGLGIGGDAARGVERLNDNMTVLGTIGTALRDKVFAQLAPSISNVVAQIGMATEGFIRAQGGGEALAKSIVGNLVGAFQRLSTFAQGVVDVFEVFKRLLGPIIDLVGTFVKGVGTIQGGLLAGLDLASTGNFREAGGAISEALSDVFSPDEQTTQTELLREQNRILQGAFIARAG